MRHLMSPLDFNVDELDKLLDLANDIEAHPEKYAHACEGKKLATCFYEPSTRTKRRKCFRYNSHHFLLRRYMCHASSKGRGTTRSITEI